MPDRSANKPPLFSPYGEGNQAPPKQYSGGLVANLAGYVEELKKVNEELRQARRAALNLMEDAVLSQEALRQSEESYRTLVNSIDEGFYLADVIFDEDNRPVDIFYHEENPSAVRIYGRSLKGKKLTEVSPDVEGYWYEILGAVALTGASKRLERYAQVDRKWFDFYATRIGDESSRQIALIFQDVTDFKNAREQLEQSRDLLQSVFDASHNGLSVLQSVRNEEGAIVDMRYLFANEATKRTNNRYDLEGKMYSEVHAGFKGTDYFDVVKQVVETGEPHHYQLHYHFEHLDNWFNITTVKLADGVVISFEDISEIKKAEIVQRETEERKAFLLQLSDALRSLTHPDEIQAAAAHTVMTYFGADRCYYSEIENDTAIIRRDAAKESLPSVAASYPLSNMPILKAVLDAGQPVVIHDANATDRVDESLRRLCLQLQILSYVGVPIIKHGRPAGILCLTQCAPRTWTATEVELMEEIAERVWGTVERAKAEEALRQSEEKYRSLFAKMDEGFGIAEVIFDEKGSPVDYRLLEINEQFEKLTGAPRELLLSGKTFLEILPGQKNTDRYKFCHQVALTGVPVRFEDYSEIFGRWFDMNIFRPNPSNKTQIAVLFSNVTERKRKEANLQFLSEVTAQFSMLSSADEIMQRVGEKIGAYTKVGSCNFIDINEAAEKEITVRHSWHRPDFPVFPQAFRTADYLSEEFERANRAGEIIVVCNTQTDIRTNTLGYDALKINAFITVPFFHAGERKYLLAVSSPEPRDWRADEIELFQELANVIFPRLEQVRAIEALRESEARFRLMADSVPLSIWITDAAGRAEFLNKHWCDYAGVSFEPTTAATIAADFLHPDDAPAVMAAFAAAMQAGEGFEIEQRNRSASGEYRWFLNRAEPYRDPRSNAVIKWFGVGVDIHDRKLAEKALEESEERLRTLADAVPQIIWSNDANGKANYFNQRWYEYTGLNYEQSAGPGWQVIVHPQDAPASAEKWKQALAAGAVFDTEYRLRNAAGDYRWFIGRNVPLKDETGKIAGWFGTATDIEDLKKADEALSRSEARLRVTMESATDYAIITMDTERRMEKWSSGASKIFGYTEAEVIGQTADIIFTEEDRKEGVPQKEMETARDTGRAANERWHQSKNGSRFFLSGVMRPIFNPKLSGYVKVARDVTEQKAAEETLRMLEERYRIALQSAEMAAWDWRVVDNEVTWNEQHFRLFGLAPSSQKIDAGFFLQFIHEADRRRVSEELQSALNETGVYQAEFRILRADNNEVRWMTGYGKVVEKNEGRGTRMVGVMYDSTERRLVTEELNRLVAERTTELQRSNEDLRQFAHVTSHDLKEPIRKIQTFNNRILDEYAQALPSRAKTYAEKIGTAADRMVSMIEGVLRYSKLGNNEGALDAVNLNEVVQQIVIDLEVMMAQKHAMITKAEMPTITANATLMYQLFYNLILNSLKFSKAEEPSRIAISAEVIKQDDKDFNCIILSDNGIGFEPEFAQDIFKTFTRLHPAEEYEGTGLGLALCKKIVERHGGTIVASGELGKGAVFTIRLPLSND